MKLNKDKWEKIKLGEIAMSSNLSCNPLDDGIERFVAGGHMITDEIKIKNWGIVKDEILGPAFHRKFLPNQILYGSRRTYLRKVAIADFEGVCANTTFVIDIKENRTIILFLIVIMQSERFNKFSINNSKGSTNPFINWKDLANYEFPLPPIEEQKQIAALFQSIETAMEQVDGQEKNLKVLRKSLINKLTKQNPVFGNLLTKSNCKEYSIGELAVEVPDRTDNPQKSGIEKFIGLEDFESGELTIQKFSSTEKLVSAMKLCKQGNVLFARRNTYLKRASLTDFDAVCSGDVIVMRANEEVILPKFLILVMNTDEFWEFAISNAAGTMSKRIKWRDLATYSFDLPDLKVQEKVVAVFTQLQTVLQHLKQQKTTLKQLKQTLLNEILG